VYTTDRYYYPLCLILINEIIRTNNFDMVFGDRSFSRSIKNQNYQNIKKSKQYHLNLNELYYNV